MPDARKVTPKPAAGGKPGKALDVDRFCAEIVAHRHTGRLGDIIKAVIDAAASGPSSLRWKITLDPLGEGYAGREITEDSITLAAVVTAERYAGHSWKTLSPVESAADCHALIVGWLVEDAGLAVTEAVELTKKIAMSDIVGMVGTYEVGHGPKEGGTAAVPVTG